MSPLTATNAAANVIIAIAVIDMAIRVFGNREHRIHCHPELFWIRKAISSMVICGAVLNIATLSTPSWTETLLNVAFAANYCFSSYYDRLARTQHPTKPAEIPKRRTPSRAANTGKGAKKSSPSVYRGKRTSTR
jgi:hypothetical protein